MLKKHKFKNKRKQKKLFTILKEPTAFFFKMIQS